jgi:hypothetical protein
MATRRSLATTADRRGKEHARLAGDIQNGLGQGRFGQFQKCDIDTVDGGVTHGAYPLAQFAHLVVGSLAAVGVDGVTWQAYEAILQDRVHELYRQIHTGAYRAQVSRRTYIAKTDGKLRPLGIAAVEDKIVQQAVVKVLSAIYEEDYLGFSCPLAVGVEKPSGCVAPYETSKRRTKPPKDGGQVPAYSRHASAWLVSRTRKG